MIPKIVHLVYGLKKDFGNIPFSLMHYLCVKSIVDVHKPDIINYYYRYEPTGKWWDLAKPYLNLEQIEPPKEIFGNKIYHVAHQTDVIRLQLILEYGGIVMDMDTISVKPFDDLLNNKFVMGVEGDANNEFGLCNSVIMGEKGAEFADIWLREFRTFRSKGRDKYWNEHAVLIPHALSKIYPEKIHIEPYNSFFNPLYDGPGLKMLFEETHIFDKAYCHHLWETNSWESYLKNLTIKDIKTKDTSYNLIARRFIQDLEVNEKES